MPSGSGWITWRRMIFVAPALGSATVQEANSNRFNSCSVTPQSKRRNGTLGADRSSKMRSTIGSKYHWQVGRDNPVYHVGDEARLGSAQNQEICKVLCPHCSVSASAIMYSPSSVFPSENEWTPTRCLLPMCDEIHTSTFLPDGEPVQWLVFA